MLNLRELMGCAAWTSIGTSGQAGLSFECMVMDFSGKVGMYNFVEWCGDDDQG